MIKHIQIVYKMMLNRDPFDGVDSMNSTEYQSAVKIIKQYIIGNEPTRARLWASNNDRDDLHASLRVPYQIISTFFAQPVSEELKWLDDVLNSDSENV